MRIGRSGSAAVLAGALALGAFSAPSAQAVSSDSGVKVTNLIVNKGAKTIVVGTTAVVEPAFSFHMWWPAGSSLAEVEAFPFLYHGTTAAKGADGDNTIYWGSESCYEDGTQAADCVGTLDVDPRDQLDSNKDATSWKVGVNVRVWSSKDSSKVKSHEILSGFGAVQIKRAARVTVNASPEPVKKGKTLTVTGSITRADWVKHKYTGFGGKSAKLQFRKAGSSTYSTVKIVKSNASGKLKTTVKASADGYWRWTFGETNTTGGATAAGDYVDVN